MPGAYRCHACGRVFPAAYGYDDGRGAFICKGCYARSVAGSAPLPAAADPLAQLAGGAGHHHHAHHVKHVPTSGAQMGTVATVIVGACLAVILTVVAINRLSGPEQLPAAPPPPVALYPEPTPAAPAPAPPAPLVRYAAPPAPAPVATVAAAPAASTTTERAPAAPTIAPVAAPSAAPATPDAANKAYQRGFNDALYGLSQKDWIDDDYMRGYAAGQEQATHGRK